MSVKIDDGITKMLNVIAGKNPEKILEPLAMKGIQIMSERTAKGIGLKGKFKPYSKQYEKAKGKTTVNLDDTGEMWRSIKISVINVKSKVIARIFFPSRTHSKSKENIKKIANINHKTRPFFGLLKSEKTVLGKLAVKLLKRHYG